MLCIIVGNGPSLKNEDLSLISDLPQIAFNHSYFAWQEMAIKPKYYACFDPVALEDSSEQIKLLQTKYQGLQIILSKQALDFGVKESDKTSFLQIVSSDKIIQPPGYLADLGSVAASSIPYLVSLGYDKFILLGIDARYSVLSEGIPVGDGLVMVENDPDHFSPEYSAGKRRKVTPDLRGMFDGWQKLAQAQELLSIKIINASSGSALNCFPLMSLKKALIEIYE